MRRIVPLIAVAMLATFVACGDDGPGGTVAEAAEKLGEIDSADMSLSITLSSEDSGPVGFEVTGLYQAAAEGELPIADVTIERLMGEASSTSRFISTGSVAFLEVDGTSYELGDEQVASLLGGPEAESSNLFEGIDVSDWVIDGETSESDGARTVTGDLDVVAAFEDLFALGRSFGVGLPELTDDTKEHLDAAAESGSIEMVIGEDGFLRDLRVDMGLAAEIPEEMNGLLVPSADIQLLLTLDQVNEPVSVDAPSDARPIEELEVTG